LRGHAGAEYVLTGPQFLTQFEQVSLIGRAIGRSLHIEEISPEEATREWFPTWPSSVVNMLLDAWAAAIGLPAFVTSAVTETIAQRLPMCLLRSENAPFGGSSPGRAVGGSGIRASYESPTIRPEWLRNTVALMGSDWRAVPIA
jgi:hypothetical protein